MFYFSEFPKVVYNLESDNFNGKLCTNITVRNTFLRDIQENLIISYDYPAKDSDKPEFIAHKLYDDVYRHWMVMLNNDIYNPYYDFPLTSDNLNNYIMNKYDVTFGQMFTQVHHYEKVITKEYYKTGALNKTTVERTEINDKVTTLSYDEDGNETVTVSERTDLPDTEAGFFTLSIPSEGFDESFDDGTRVVVSVKHDAITIYDYEFALNEQKRQLRLIDKSYVVQIEDEFKALMRNG